MSTAFYVLADATCDNPAHTEQVHVGTSSGGWKFLWHAYPADLVRPRGVPVLETRAQWEDWLATRTIEDEYGRVYSLVSFLERIDPDEGEPDGKGHSTVSGLKQNVTVDADGHDLMRGAWY